MVGLGEYKLVEVSNVNFKYLGALVSSQNAKCLESEQRVQAGFITCYR